MSDKVKAVGEQLIEALACIPVSELVQCARENLKATKITRTTRGQKDPETGERLPDTVNEPDYVTRQKALEWISAQLAGTPDKRPASPAKTDPEAGSLEPVKPKSPRKGSGQINP